jgi:HEAT repeat protein
MPESPSRRVPPGHPGNVALPWLPAMGRPTVEAALRDAESPKPRFRRDAAVALRDAGAAHRDPAQAALRGLLADPDPGVRLHAAESLAALRDVEAAEPIAALADDPAFEVRTAAVGALADLFPDDAAPLIRLAGHDRGDVRAEAAAELGGRSDPAAREALRTLLGDAESVVRATAAWAAEAAGRTFVPDLRKRLEDDDGDVRRAAAVSLAGLDDPAGLPVLRRRLDERPRDAAWTTCLAALAAVAGSEDRDRLSRLAGWLSPRNVRTLALAALARLGDARALAAIRKDVARGGDRRRADALLAAGHARLDALVPEIRAVIEHPGDPAFTAAVRAAVPLAEATIGRAVVELARTTADRSVFEVLAGAAADMVARMGDDAPSDLRRLARAVYRPDGDPLEAPGPAAEEGKEPGDRDP